MYKLKVNYPKKTLLCLLQTTKVHIEKITGQAGGPGEFKSPLKQI